MSFFNQHQLTVLRRFPSWVSCTEAKREQKLLSVAENFADTLFMNDTEGCEVIPGFVIGCISEEKTGLCLSNITWNKGCD